MKTYSRTGILESSGGGRTVNRSNGWGDGDVLNVGHFDNLKETVLVKWTMLKLSPVMSSMLSCFHTPVVSGVHAMLQAEPSLKTSPGLGSEGTTSAKATKTEERINAGRARRDSISVERWIKKVGKLRGQRESI